MALYHYASGWFVCCFQRSYHKECCFLLVPTITHLIIVEVQYYCSIDNCTTSPSPLTSISRRYSIVPQRHLVPCFLIYVNVGRRKWSSSRAIQGCVHYVNLITPSQIQRQTLHQALTSTTTITGEAPVHSTSNACYRAT